MTMSAQPRTQNPEPNEATPQTHEQCTQVVSQASTIPHTERHGVSVPVSSINGELAPHRSVRAVEARLRAKDEPD